MGKKEKEPKYLRIDSDTTEEEYKKKKGFVFDNIEDYMAGEKIKNIEDLYKFIE